MNKPLWIVTLALLMLVAACGDSPGSVEPAASKEVPASATASARAYSSYASSLGADDRAEPLEVDKVTAPTSETDDPIDLG